MAKDFVEKPEMVMEAMPEKKAKKKGFFRGLASAFTFGSKSKTSITTIKEEEDEELDRNLSCEEVDSDDMAGGLCDSDDEDGAQRRAVFKAVRSEKRSTRGADSSGAGAGAQATNSKKYNQEFDTNVFEVKLDCLENKGEVATGDAQLCKTCSGVFSKLSKLATETDQ